MELLLIVVLVAVVVLVVSAPLRSRRAGEATESAELAELEAARDAKYREIRDAELDYRTGKLSEADWRAADRALRAEAMDILRRLDELDPPTSEPRRAFLGHEAGRSTLGGRCSSQRSRSSRSSSPSS